MKNYQSYKLFSSPVFHFTLENFKELNLELENFILSLRKNDEKGQKKSNAGGWHSKNFDINKENTAKKFATIVQRFVKKVVKDEMGWKYASNKVIIEAMWSIINKKGSFNIQHNHPNAYLSAAYYVKFPKNSGNIKFFDPKEQKNIRYPHTKKYTELSAAVTSIEPEEGNLLLFPSYLYHSVDENKSDDERIVISFNIDIIN